MEIPSQNLFYQSDLRPLLKWRTKRELDSGASQLRNVDGSGSCMNTYEVKSKTEFLSP